MIGCMYVCKLVGKEKLYVINIFEWWVILNCMC